MPNLRIISDNALDRAASFAATNTNANYPVANMLTDDKSNTWRTNGTGFTTLTATWAAPESIAAVVFPFCAFSPTTIGKIRISTERTTTNYARTSDVISGWIDNGSSSWTAAAGIAPDGTNTAVRGAVRGSGGSTGDRYLAVDGLTAGVMTFSMFAKAGTTAQVNLYVDFSAGGAALAAFNLATGACTFTADAKTLSARIAILSNGWYRAELTMAVPVGSAYLHAIVVGAANTTALLWGAQLEYGAVASSFYPTTGVALQRPSGYIDSWQFYQYDSGNVLLCPAAAVKLRGFTAAQAAGAYAYGGGTIARVWFPTLAATGIRMDIDNSDGSNAPGYLEIGKAIIGPYWTPTYNASAASLTFVDTTAIDRTDAGGQIADAGYIYKRVPIDLSMMPATDRGICARFLRNSRAYPIFLSLFPDDVDLELERDHSVYGRRTQDSDLAIENSIYYGTKIAVEEI